MKRNVIVNLRENGAISVLVVWNVRYVGGIMWSTCDMEMGVCGTTKRFLVLTAYEDCCSLRAWYNERKRREGEADAP